MTSELSKLLAPIAERASKATEGPWLCEGFSRRRWSVQTFLMTGEAIVIANEVSPLDGSFIAHSRADIPALLKVVETLERGLLAFGSTFNEDGQMSQEVLVDAAGILRKAEIKRWRN